MTESDAIHGREQAPARDAPLCKNCRYIFGHWYRRPQGDLPLADTWYISKIHCTPSQLLRNARTCPSCYLLLASKNVETVVRIVRSDPIGSYEVALIQEHTQVVALRFKTSSDALCLMYSVQGARGKCPHDQANFLRSSKVL